MQSSFPIFSDDVDSPAVLKQLIYLVLQEASGYDSVRFRFIETLIKRALNEREAVRDSLLVKAQLALDDYCKDMAGDRADDQKFLVKAPLTPSPLCELVHYLSEPLKQGDESTVKHFDEQLQQQETAVLNTSTNSGLAPSAPTNTLRASNTYQKIQAEKRLDDFIDIALSATPENPGPLNPEILVIRLLSNIRDLSPEYLSRYVIYFETLQYLVVSK